MPQADPIPPHSMFGQVPEHLQEGGKAVRMMVQLDLAGADMFADEPTDEQDNRLMLWTEAHARDCGNTLDKILATDEEVQKLIEKGDLHAAARLIVEKKLTKEQVDRFTH